MFIFVGEKKTIKKRILIAAINGIIGAFIAFFASIIVYSEGLLILMVGPAIFMVNFVPALMWEKNENNMTKSKKLTFLSPVIKGVIVGVIIGALEAARIFDVSEGWYFGWLLGGYVGAIIGAVIGQVQVAVNNFD